LDESKQYNELQSIPRRMLFNKSIVN